MATATITKPAAKGGSFLLETPLPQEVFTPADLTDPYGGGTIVVGGERIIVSRSPIAWRRRPPTWGRQECRPHLAVRVLRGVR